MSLCCVASGSLPVYFLSLVYASASNQVSLTNQFSLSAGRTFLLNRWPLPLLLVSSGGYLGYHKYKWREQPEGAPPVLATPTQVGHTQALYT